MAITGVNVRRLQGRHHFNRVDAVGPDWYPVDHQAEQKNLVESLPIDRDTYATLVAERFFTKLFVGRIGAKSLINRFKWINVCTIYPNWDLEWEERMPGLNHNRGWFLYALAAEPYFNDGANHYAWLGANYKHYLGLLAQVEAEVHLVKNGMERKRIDVHV